MKKRSPLAVLLLTIITFGIYGIYWEVVTKGELVRKGADIPTALLLIVPIANIWWAYKYCMGVEKVTNGKMSGVLALVLMLVLGVVGMAILQDAYNNVPADVAQAPAPSPEVPSTPVAPTAPTTM